MSRISNAARVGVVETAQVPHGGLNVGVASQVALAANADRIGVYLCNASVTERIFLGFGLTAAVDEGVLLPPGQGVYLDTYKGAISAIAGATARLTWTEV